MTVYANLVDGDLKGVYDLLPPVWNSITDFNTKAKADEAFMKENGFVKIVRDTTAFNSETHKMSDFPWYTVENGNVIEHRDILEIPPAEPEPEPEQTTDTQP
jgi:hypothetical protein